MDEFSFLSTDAARFDITGPFNSVERITTRADNGEELSAMKWGDARAR